MHVHRILDPQRGSHERVMRQGKDAAMIAFALSIYSLLAFAGALSSLSED